MQTFIAEHTALIWVVVVVLVTLLLLFSTQKLFAFLRRRDETKGHKNANLLKALRRVFRMFFIVFGLGLISYVFFQKEAHELITQNLIRVLWITLVLAVTLIVAALSQTYFANRTAQEKKDGKSVVDVQVIGLGESSVNIRAWVWGASFVTAFKMRNDLYKSIKQRFDREGVEIPFPHRTVVLKNAPSSNLKPLNIEEVK